MLALSHPPRAFCANRCPPASQRKPQRSVTDPPPFKGGTLAALSQLANDPSAALKRWDCRTIKCHLTWFVSGTACRSTAGTQAHDQHKHCKHAALHMARLAALFPRMMLQ